MRRGWLILVAILAAVAVVLYVLRGPIAVRLTRAAAERAIGGDALAEMPDGLNVVLCGAGSPLPDPLRSGPCVAVIAGRHLYEVDAGDGAARMLTRLGLPPGRVEALFLTHFHSDHIDGLGELTVLRWAGGNHSEPLPVFGPTGVETVVDGFNQAYSLDAKYRLAHHGPEVVPPSGAGGKAFAFDLPAEGKAPVIWSVDGLTVRAFQVRHDPVKPAVGYRFDYGGRSVLISGDTAKSANLEQFAEGVDVLVHEALSPQLVAAMHDAAIAVNRPLTAKVLSDILSYHTSPVDAAEIAAAAQVSELVFYHIIPPLRVPGSEAAFLKGVSRVYGGRVVLGRDGTQVSLPRDSTVIDNSQRSY